MAGQVASARFAKMLRRDVEILEAESAGVCVSTPALFLSKFDPIRQIDAFVGILQARNADIVFLCSKGAINWQIVELTSAGNALFSPRR